MTTFYWCRGQDENIGDVVLRRRLLRTLCAHRPVVALLGRASPGFVDAVRTDLPVEVVMDERAWLRRAYRGLRDPDWALVLNPGELPFDRRQAVTHAALLPLLARARARSRPTLRAGAGARAVRTTVIGLPVVAAVRLTDRLIWRDPRSAVLFGRGATMPDWAFDERLSDNAGRSRTHLAITLRGDRPRPDARWVAGVRAAAAELRLTPLVFVQVRHDAQRAEWLGQELGCEVMAWPAERAHLDQEIAVRGLLQRSSHVVSDRLHALVIGASEGAGMVAPVPGSADKIVKTFEHLGLDQVARDVSAMTAATITAFVLDVAQRRAETMALIEAARRWVRAVDDEVAVYLSGDRVPSG